MLRRSTSSRKEGMAALLMVSTTFVLLPDPNLVRREPMLVLGLEVRVESKQDPHSLRTPPSHRLVKGASSIFRALLHVRAALQEAKKELHALGDLLQDHRRRWRPPASGSSVVSKAHFGDLGTKSTPSCRTHFR